MNVTIMSDTSFCHQTKSSGWGVWIKSERGQSEQGGNFRGHVNSSHVAEARALAIAVFSAFQWGIALPQDVLILQTDCQMVIDAYYDRATGGKDMVDAIKYIKKAARDNNCLVKIKHVKAHVPGLAPRNWVNNRCDTLAKKAMRAERQIKLSNKQVSSVQ